MKVLSSVPTRVRKPLSNPCDSQLLRAEATSSTNPMMTSGPMFAVKPFQPYPSASVAENGRAVGRA